MPRRRKSSKEERVCSICSQSFNKAEHLERHLRSHTNEKPFRCQVCDKMFARQYVLGPPPLTNQRRDLTRGLRDTLLRHSRSHQKDHQKTGIRSRSHLVGGRPDPSYVSGPASSADATEASIAGLTLLEMSPQPSLVNQEAETIRNTYFEANTSTIVDTCESNMIVDLGAAHADMPPLGVPFDQQSDTIPQWTSEMDIDTQWMSCLAGDSFSVDLLNFSLPFPTPDPSQAMMEISQATMANISGSSAMTPTFDLPFKPETTIQSKWHTWTAVRNTSEDTTPYPSQGRYHIDEACRQSITDRLRPRAQEGPVPSIEFLVSNYPAILC